MRRRLSWRQALSDLQADRITPPEIREVPIAGNRRCREVLSCWRGRSGRRYVVQVHELGADWPARAGAGLAFAVAREGGRHGRLVEIAPEAPEAAWFGRMRKAGVTELHVYTLAEDADRRAAVATDLVQS